MSTVLRPRAQPAAPQPPPPDAGKASWLWFGLVVIASALLLVATLELRPARVAATRAAAAPTVGEEPPAPVADAADRLPSAECPRLAVPASSSRELQPEVSAIHAAEVERLQAEWRRNEALPPEERRPLAPTADMLRALRDERGIRQ